MTIYKSPWARKFERTQIINHIKPFLGEIISGIAAIILFTFMLYCLLHAAVEEGRIAEQQRIYRMVKDHDKGMAVYIAEMEKAGRGK